MENHSLLVRSIIKGMQEKKGSRIVVADLSSIETAPCQHFIICEAGSPQQVEAITRSVEEQARLRAHEKPSAIIGRSNAQWVAMDYGTELVHIFLPDMREYYDLEHLWQDAELTTLPDAE